MGGLSGAAQQAISQEQDGGDILVSSISAWEIALLVQASRIELATDTAAWLQRVERVPRVRFVPVDNEIAVGSVELPGLLHKDPADRIIIATARRFGAPLVTGDEKIRGYPHVRTIW